MSALFTLGLIGLIGFLCQWLSQKVKLPAILFLLLSGILAGPTLGLIDPNELFGNMLFPFISLSVAVILFEGALTLKRQELKGIGRPVQNMVTIGVLVNGSIMCVATHYVIGLSWSLSALFGALMVVTGPTVIMPMLKAIRPNRKIADVLRWEGIVIDPIGALIAVLVFEWIAVQNKTAEFSEIFTVFGGTVAVGLAIGIVAGYLFGLLLRHHYIPEKLHNFSSLAIVCFVFAASDTLMHESGLLAVTVMGVLLANMKDVHINAILEFKEDLTVVFVSALFIVLAARLNFAGFAALGWSALLLLLIMQFIARPLKVALSFRGSDFTLKEKALVAWIGPRGIVAAAVSAVFALRLEELGVPDAEKLVPLAFLIIIGTVVLQSLTGGPLARALGVAMPKTYGLVVIGANPFSLALTEALNKIDVETVICDTNWELLSRARILGINTYYGNPSSEHADIHLNLSPYGYMLGLSNHFEYNVTQANGFRDDFGARNVFILPPNQSTERFHKHVASPHNSGRLLFNEDSTHLHLKKQINSGAGIRITEFSETYSYKEWRTDNQAALILMAVKPNGDLTFNTLDHDLKVSPGDKLIYLSASGDNKKEEIITKK
jgi:CPA1 family monovalent cation:H+ antiporter